MVSTQDMMALEKALGRLRLYGHMMAPEPGSAMKKMLPPATEMLAGRSPEEEKQLLEAVRALDAADRAKRA